jgi:hypothetical protein
MVEISATCMNPYDNAGIVLGTVMAELAQEGRDKLTLILPPELTGFGYWVEQLVAESTGKNGEGVIPVDGETVVSPEHYGDDRLFVYVSLQSHAHPELEEKVHALEQAGQPVVNIQMEDIYDLGQEYYRWEIATATACAILGVNAFDQPNVQESKDNTNRLIAEFKKTGTLPVDSPVLQEDGISLYCDEETRAVLDKMRTSGAYQDRSILSYVSAHLNRFQPANYFVLMAFVQDSEEVTGLFEQIRESLRDAYTAATTFGYGPRFLHSTGQLHKGGPNTGVYIQFTADDVEDIPISGEPYGFSTLKEAQALGDAIALIDKGRPFIRLHLGSEVIAGLHRVHGIIAEALKEQTGS